MAVGAGSMGGGGRAGGLGGGLAGLGGNLGGGGDGGGDGSTAVTSQRVTSAKSHMAASAAAWKGVSRPSNWLGSSSATAIVDLLPSCTVSRVKAAPSARAPVICSAWATRASAQLIAKVANAAEAASERPDGLISKVTNASTRTRLGGMAGGGGEVGGGAGPPNSSTVHQGRVVLYRPRLAHWSTTVGPTVAIPAVGQTTPKRTGHAP